MIDEKLNYVPVNLNSSIKVRLTDAGREYFKGYCKGLTLRYGVSPARLEEDSEGWSIWTGWEFFCTFGNIMDAGSRVMYPGIQVLVGEHAIYDRNSR